MNKALNSLFLHWRHLLSVVLLLCTAGCEVLELPSLDLEPSPFTYHRWLKQATAPELQSELSNLERKASNSESAYPLVQQAMLALTTAEPDFNTLQNAQELLTRAREPDRAHSGTDDDYLAFAELLDELLALKIIQIRSTEALASESRRNSELNREIQELRQTINAITDIEQQLIRRENDQEQP